MDVCRWSPCLSTWRRGLEDSVFASISPCSPSSCMFSPRSQWVAAVTPNLSSQWCDVCLFNILNVSFILFSPFSLVHSGRHVFWRHFYQPGSGAEHLHRCCRAVVDHRVVHCHRSVHSGWVHIPPFQQNLWNTLNNLKPEVLSSSQSE